MALPRLKHVAADNAHDILEKLLNFYLLSSIQIYKTEQNFSVVFPRNIRSNNFTSFLPKSLKYEHLEKKLLGGFTILRKATITSIYIYIYIYMCVCV
jgi:hypothetical protein